ncbi:KilA-N domain-containing protein [Endozoicomonas sp. 4G]|uniref:KilA-N domain-containing protein n=1 Tax=Endozoicomonas sp. 4G TaxID=2872754 RepID=UPI002078551D|nr:KilA-N domain-containing protein [Endozoicomonas sp. 4G]
MRAFTLKLNGQNVPLIENDEGMVNLNELHKLSGEPGTRSPKRWLELDRQKDRKSDFLKVRGRSGGIWANRRDALKYAGYLSEEFEDAVYEAFENLMDGRTEAAVAAVHRMYGKAMRDDFTGATGRESNRLDNRPEWM